MQTFLPYPNFTVSAMCLDYRRLGKQRVECKQLITAIQTVRDINARWADVTVDEWNKLKNDAAIAQGFRKVPWANHPCTTMWRNHVVALMSYHDCCIREWVRRGYNNTMELMMCTMEAYVTATDYETPDWLGDEQFHASHRGNLLRKDHEHYSTLGWTESPDLEYIWPL